MKNHHDARKSGMPRESDDAGGAAVRDIRVVDFAIVGAGTAGCPLAKFLSDDPNVSVHVGEGGSDTRTDPNVLDTSGGGGALFTPPFFTSPKYHWLFGANVAPLGLNPGAPPFYLEGRMWGGSSGHNFSLTVRGTPALYGEWATVDPQWSYEALLPAMRALETYTALASGVVNPAERGTDGPLFVTQLPSASPSDPFFDALGAAGVPFSPDYNDPTQGVYVAGVNQLYVTPTTQERSWAASAFLPPSVVTTNEDGDGVGVGDRDLFIDSDAVAITLLFEDDFTEEELTAIDREHGLTRLTRNGSCSRSCKRTCPCRNAALNVLGVRYVVEDHFVDVLARRKVIACLGGVADPALLQFSGIGPADVLEPLGIPVRLDQPNVGRQMQNHYGPLAILPIRPDSTGFQIQAFFPDDSGSGPDGPRGYQGIFAGFNDPASGGAVQAILADLRPARVGRVEIVRKGLSEPFITFNFYQDADDVADALRMLRLVRDISLAYTGEPPLAPDPSVYAGGDAALLAYAIANTTIFNHNSGTCRMAATAADGVVDGDLDVHGVRGLGIASNSVAPSIEDGNTAWTAYVIGMTKAKIEGARVPF